MSNFINLTEALRSMATDASTASQPIKRMFVADGDFMSANVSVLEEPGDALHSFRSEVVTAAQQYKRGGSYFVPFPALLLTGTKIEFDDISSRPGSGD
jgi:hypothetical protein